jgi:dTDP-4-dehydrorhamnose reductase
MTWLITGGAGQLGTALKVVLNERKIDFIAWGSEDLDIRSAKKTLELVGSLKPSVVINAAAWTDVDAAESDIKGAHAVNTVGAYNLSVASKAVNAVFVQVSTDFVFSGIGSKPWKNDDALEPTSVYGQTKMAGENEVLSNYPERSYIFRTAWLYSPWGKNFVKTMLKLALEGTADVRVVIDQVGQPTFAIDLANQIVDSVVHKLPFGIYHATNSGQASWHEFAQAVFKFVRADVSRIIPVTSSEYLRPAKRPSYSVLCHVSWEKTPLSPMRDWENALQDALPSIISAVKEE